MLCMLAVMLLFTGCSSSQNKDLKYDKANIEQVTEFLIGYCASADDATIEQWNSMSDFALEQQLTEAGLPFTPDSFMSTLDAWKQANKECGAYESHGDYKFEVSKKELTVTTEAKFEKRNADITFKFDEKMFLDSVTVDAQYTRVEMLEKAGLNTLLGMGTVFSVLIFISLIISLFRFIPKIQHAFTGKPVQTAPKKEKVEKQIVPAVSAPKEAAPDDRELIAVIAAAIAAAEGTSVDGFIVRSIKRRPANKWS